MKSHDAIQEFFSVNLEVHRRLSDDMVKPIRFLKAWSYSALRKKRFDLERNAALGDYVKQHYGNDFVYVIDWPSLYVPSITCCTKITPA